MTQSLFDRIWGDEIKKIDNNLPATNKILEPFLEFFSQSNSEIKRKPNKEHKGRTLGSLRRSGFIVPDLDDDYIFEGGDQWKWNATK
jgi:hypothetical protein